jgi:ABC-2 type transport system permease protein
MAVPAEGPGPARELRAPPEVRSSEPPRLHPWRRLGELWANREILVNLTRKEVKVKYTSSVLGAAWSMLNPIMYLAVFSLVFKVVLDNGVPAFSVFLLSGLLAWNLFANSLSLAARSVVENAALVNKVAFPREILPLASIGATLVDFALQALVLVLFLVVFRYPFVGWNLLLLPLSLVALLAFTAALAQTVAALNVRYRDTQHLLNLALLAWFWLTPVVYPAAFLQQKIVDGLGSWAFDLYLVLNPLAVVVSGFQRSLYRFVRPPGAAQNILIDASLGELAIWLSLVIVGSLLLGYALWRGFFRLAGDFAEEL